jgi:excisionase family DNA binding protein
MPAGGSNRLLNLSKAAEYLDLPPRRLRDNWQRWGITAYHVGRELRFRERDLEAYLSRNIAVAA